MYTTLQNLVWCVPLLILTSCASDDDGDPSNGNSGQEGDEFSSSLPADTPLGELDEEQSQTLCEELGEYGYDSGFAGDLVEYSCRVQGALAAAAADPATDAEARSACTPAYDDCIDQFLPAAQDPTQADGECDPQPANCTVTVGEYSACVTQGVQAVHDTLQTAPACDTLTLDDLELESDVWRVITPLCDAIDESCPG